MSDREDTPHADTCGADVAAYALGALTPEETVAFETHLASCAVCSAELVSFQHVIDAMAVTPEPQRAPRALRRRVLRTVHQEARARKPRQTSNVSEFFRTATARPTLAAGGLLAAAAIAFGVVEVSSPGSATHVYQAQVTGHGSAQLTVEGAHAELAVRHFAALPKGHIYEVWLARAGKAPVPARAVFKVTAAGDGEVHLPVQVRHGDQILVTAEPKVNSHPTTTPIMSVQLT